MAYPESVNLQRFRKVIVSLAIGLLLPWQAPLPAFAVAMEKARGSAQAAALSAPKIPTLPAMGDQPLNPVEVRPTIALPGSNAIPLPPPLPTSSIPTAAPEVEETAVAPVHGVDRSAETTSVQPLPASSLSALRQTAAQAAQVGQEQDVLDNLYDGAGRSTTERLLNLLLPAGTIRQQGNAEGLRIAGVKPVPLELEARELALRIRKALPPALPVVVALAPAGEQASIKEEATAGGARFDGLRTQAARIHGPSMREFEQQSGIDPEIRRFGLYARTPGSAKGGGNSNYFLNAEQSHQDFRAWLRNWMAGAGVTYGDWITHIKQRHLVASGEMSGRYHMGPGGYRTDEIYPGRLRDEAEVREGNYQTSPPVALHVDLWLEDHGYPGKPQLGNRVLDFSGMNELLARKNRRLREATFPKHFFYWGTIQYPHALDLDLFLEVSWKHLVASKEALVRLKLGRGPPASLEKLLRDPLFDHLADYYHTAISGHFFHKVNNSMLMPEIDTFLEELGLPPVPQGGLDLVAIRMDYLPFRQYFREYLYHYLTEKKPDSRSPLPSLK